MRGHGLLILLMASWLPLAMEAQGDAPLLPRPILRLDKKYLEKPKPEPFYGYPPDTLDRARLPAMLRSRQFANVERELQALQALVRVNIKREALLLSACIGLGAAHESLIREFDAWVREYPRSSVALSARATFRMARAFRTRGEARASETPPAAMAAMSSQARAAAEDADRALALDSHDYCAHHVLIDVARVSGARDLADVSTRALQAFPASYELRSALMYSLTPRWGGSYEAMEGLAEEAAASSALNPRLLTLRGSVAAEMGNDLEDEERRSEAINAFNRAIAVAPEPDFLLERGVTWLWSGDPGRAVHDLSRALNHRPQGPRTLVYHSRALFALAKRTSGTERDDLLRRGIRNLLILERIDPMNQEAAELYQYWTWFKQRCPGRPKECQPG